MADRDVNKMIPIHSWWRRYWHNLTSSKGHTEKYVIKRGDTPEKVARKANMSLREFILSNNIQSKGKGRNRSFDFKAGDTVQINTGRLYLPYEVSDKLKEAIKKAEGYSSIPYKDSKGITTIGYGFTDPSLIAEKSMGKDRANRVLDSLLNIHTQDVVRNTPNIDLVDQPFLDGTVMYHYRVGDSQYSLDHDNMMKAFENKNFGEASNQMDAGSTVGEKNRKQFEKNIRNFADYIQHYKNGGILYQFIRTWKKQ